MRLGVHMSERALKRLRDLIAPWGGKIQVLSEEDFEQASNLEGFSTTPFTSGMGILVKERTVFYKGPVERVRTGEIIHELGHIFGTQTKPDHSDEWGFFGWEIATAKHIKLPWKAWQAGSADYMLANDGWNGDEVGGLSPKELRRLVRTRLAAAREAGIVDKDFRPLNVRP